MTGGSFAGLGEVRLRRGAGFLVGVVAFIVSALVFFTEATLSAEPLAGISVKLAVTMFCCAVMYTSMTDAGCRAGEEKEIYLTAFTEWESLTARVRESGALRCLPDFCRRLAVEERQNARADLLAAAGLDEAGYIKLLSTPGELSGKPLSLRRAVRRAKNLRLLHISGESLMNSGAGHRRALLPGSPSGTRLRATVRAMVPALLGSLVTVSVALGCRDGLDAAGVISAFFRLLTLLWTGVRGYAMGFRSVTVTAVVSCRAKTAYLTRYLSEYRDKV